MVWCGVLRRTISEVHSGGTLIEIPGKEASTSLHDISDLKVSGENERPGTMPLIIDRCAKLHFSFCT